MDENYEDASETFKSAINELDDYASSISERIGLLLSEISSDEPLFDVSCLSTFEIDYLGCLKHMKDIISSESLMGGVSLIQSLRYNKDVIFGKDDGLSSGMTYDIDQSYKVRLNRGKNEKISGSVDSFESVKESFDKDIFRALVYKRALYKHLDYIDALDYEVENKEQFENELEKTKFLLQSSFFMYIGHFSIFERLLDINKSMYHKGHWIVGSDFIENSDLNFFDSIKKSLSFGKDIIRDEYLLSSYLKQSNDSGIIDLIENGIFPESELEGIGSIMEGVYKTYSSVSSQPNSNI
ncbi:MAG: hypothetical protein GQ477_03255 [Nanohaloarchaea archaeon]|nr:hypothetical protein [Candidatus Nanohaloarchaea archaeon]